MQVFLLILIFVFLLISFPWLLNKRAVNQVIKIFRQHRAVSINSAKTIDELGLRPPSFRERLMRLRDYKPAALNGLIRVGIVKATEDDKLYLSEEKLRGSKLGQG